MIRRGEIYWVNLDPTIGAEIKKTRPALVISNDQNNEHSDLVTVLPITSKTGKIYPWEVGLKKGMGGLKEDGKIKSNQIRTVDKKRLGRALLGTTLSSETMEHVELGLKIHLGIDE